MFPRETVINDKLVEKKKQKTKQNRIILIKCFQVRFLQRNEVYNCFDGNYLTATRREMARIS